MRNFSHLRSSYQKPGSNCSTHYCLDRIQLVFEMVFYIGNIFESLFSLIMMQQLGVI